MEVYLKASITHARFVCMPRRTKLFLNGFGVHEYSSIGNQLGGLLTSIDVGADGHMAGGNALLQCQGFEPIPSENTEVTHP